MIEPQAEIYFTLDEQIKEVERELALRQNVYAKRMREGKMSIEQADKHMSLLRAVLRTLFWVKKSATLPESTTPTRSSGRRELTQDEIRAAADRAERADRRR